jgi:hypothetical protein
MDEILRFLMVHCSFLYSEFDFRFVDSEVSESFGGNAYLVLASGSLRIRFVWDRSQLFAEFQSTFQPRKKEWYLIDMVRQLVEPRREGYLSLMDADHALFMRRHMREIVALFSKDRILDTIRRLKEVTRQRSRQMFG